MSLILIKKISGYHEQIEKYVRVKIDLQGLKTEL